MKTLKNFFFTTETSNVLMFFFQVGIVSTIFIFVFKQLRNQELQPITFEATVSNT